MPKLVHLPLISPEEVLSRRLWRLRDHLTLQWKEMAQLFGTDNPRMSRWKMGHTMMHLKYQKRLDDLERLNGLPFELPRPEKQVLLKHRRKKVKREVMRRTFMRDNSIDQQARVPWALLTERQSLTSGEQLERRRLKRAAEAAAALVKENEAVDHEK